MASLPFIRSLPVRRRALATAALALLAFATLTAAHVSPAAAQAISLPDGRLLTPAGRMVASGDFPATALLDGGSLFVPTAGTGPNQLVTVDTQTLLARGVEPAPVPPPSTSAAPYALSGSAALDPTGSEIYLGAGGLKRIDVFATQPFSTQVGAIDLGAFVGGVAVSQDGSRLFATLPFSDTAPFGKGSTVVALANPFHGPASTLPTLPPVPPLPPVAGGPAPQVSPPSLTAMPAPVQHSVTVGHHPLAVIDGRVAGREVVVVGNRDDGAVSVLDAGNLAPIATVATGRQPAALALTPDGRELLVVDSLDDSLAVVDTASWRVRSRLYLGDRRGLGAAPSAIALSPDGATAYVPLSMDNAVAVLARAGAGWQLTGRIPTAWYPTGVAVDAAHAQLLVTAGKGTGQPPGVPVGLPVPDAPAFNPGSSGLGGSGVVEAIPLPNADRLHADTAQVAADNAGACASCGQPRRLRGIRHVVYIIRENKTYDEELGDEPGGSRAGLLYGRAITPNTHALAERFVLLQRFFAVEDVSDTGHQAAMAGVTNDWVERFAQQAYGLDGAPRPGAELGNNDSVLWSPANYLFDNALAHGVSFRDYGEFYRHAQQADNGTAVSAALDAHVVHDFPHFGFDPSYPDTKRVAFWSADFARDVKRDSFPSLEVIYLPEDHTTQGLPASPSLAGTIQSTPQGQVADSDLATGRIIDQVSHSRYWRSTAVFLTEDDPQSGVDHVNEHRTVGLVTGGHVRTGVRTVRHYDQVGMLRTIEEILGLPPMTQFDATATAMDALFSPDANHPPFDAITPHPPALPAARIRAINQLARARLGAHPHLDSVPVATQQALQRFDVLGSGRR